MTSLLGNFSSLVAPIDETAKEETRPRLFARGSALFFFLYVSSSVVEPLHVFIASNKKFKKLFF